MTDKPQAGSCLAVLGRPGGEPKQCPEAPMPGHPFCRAHTGPLRQLYTSPRRTFLSDWREAVGTAVHHRMERRSWHEHDPDLVRALLPLALPLYSLYWRVDTFGIENIPTEGPAMLVANHSGTLPIDGAMLKVAVLKEHGRNPWLLAGEIAFRIPGFRDLVRVAGNAPADREWSVRLMREGELLGAFPEGYKGIGKGWAKRYQLQRFGRGGFVEVCIETGAPIIPTAIIGAEEAFPMVGNLGWLARKVGTPYIPIVPNGLIPLPSKWMIVFGEPIPTIGYGPKAVDDTQLVLELTEEVRATVQSLINEHLAKRGRTFI